MAIVGVTGMVGQELFNYLLKRNFPIKKLRLFASERSAGRKMFFENNSYLVEQVGERSFEGIDLAFFTAGSEISKTFAELAVNSGATVIDNTSAFRLNRDIPLVIPEVNGESLRKHKGIISNPNCSTIQLVLALSEIKKAFGISRILVSTYQSISGAGRGAVETFKEQVSAIVKDNYNFNVLRKADHPFAFNLVPQIDQFDDGDYTGEEIKMIKETKKIFSDDQLKISATCIRVPVFNAHSESVYVEINQEGISKEEFLKALTKQASVKLLDQPAEKIYPTPVIASGKEKVYVGRVRKDYDIDQGFHLWIVSDNILKGAALNSIHVAEALLAKNLI